MLLILFLTLGILLNVIVHVFLIFNESLLALSQCESFCISIFKSCSFFLQIFPLDKNISVICIHYRKGDL